MEITKKTTMGQLLSYDRGVAIVLMQAGMHCIGCALSSEENVEQACMAHGVDVDNFLERCNEVIADFAID